MKEQHLFWRNAAPPRVQMFMWLLLQGRIQCRSVLHRKHVLLDCIREVCNDSMRMMKPRNTLIAVGHVSSIAGPKYCPLQFCFFFSCFQLCGCNRLAWGSRR